MPSSRLSAVQSWIDRTFIPEFDGDRGEFGAFEGGLLIVVAMGLTVAHFGGSETTFLELFGESLAPGGRAELARQTTDSAELVHLLDHTDRWLATQHPDYQLWGLFHWVGFCVLGFAILPALYVRLCGRRIRDMHLGWGGLNTHWQIYAVLYCLIFSAVFGVSFLAEYQEIYPFYEHAGRSYYDFLAWELAYGIQFLVLEFLFRGVMLSGLRKWLGYGAIFVMIIPYCMIHFGKTGSESVGAIFAGIILGSLAMKYRSIWGGVLLHWAVAITMDLFALWQKGHLPTDVWPP